MACVWRRGPRILIRPLPVSVQSSRGLAQEMYEWQWDDPPEVAKEDPKRGPGRGMDGRSGPHKYKFVDRARVAVHGGRGGDGCISYEGCPAHGRRPTGGHGGAGGDVFVEATEGMYNLSLPTPHINGGPGQNGGPKGQKGRRGKRQIIQVPCGTVVKQVQTKGGDAFWYDKLDGMELTEQGKASGPIEELEVLADLDTPGATVQVATGGKPGLGNAILAGSRSHSSMKPGKLPGELGESVDIELELKTIADIGLVGYPNAGKSTLLAAISRATPKIASYPFTTLSPIVGLVEYSDTHRLRIADIPGLVDGAHMNRGLGHRFLRHIERTRSLLYVVDAAGSEGRDPCEDLIGLYRELSIYDPSLTQKPAVVLANKLDLAGADEHLERLRKLTPLQVFPASAATGAGLVELMVALRKAAQLVP